MQRKITRTIALGPVVRDRRAHDVAAQPFGSLSLLRAAAHPGMQAEAVRLGAQARRGFLIPARCGSQAQHLLSDAWGKR